LPIHDLIDLDQFKAHQRHARRHAGAAAMRGVARTICEHRRDSDIAGRLCGDEFALRRRTPTARRRPPQTVRRRV
jgi:GGDEF domain-containing protein